MSQAFPKPGKKQKPEKPGSPAKKSITLTPAQRQKIYQKYDGRCSYCGHGIEYHEMQVDHIEARAKFSDSRDADFWENLTPSCRPCNIRKNTMSIKRFRAELSRDIEQLKRDQPKFRLLLKYNLISVNSFPVVFYFEKVKKGKS